MRISRLQLRDVKRYRDLQIDLAPGLTIIRGPNEAGKSTISRAIELGLTGSVVAGADPGTAGGLDGLRSWDADEAARPTITLDFSVDAGAAGGPDRTGSIEKAFGPGGTASLTIDGVTTTDPAAVDARLADLTGVPTPSFFRSTAFVGHGELEDLDRDEATLRERLAVSISAADRSTTEAIEELRRVLAELNTRGERDPGQVGVAEEAVARSEATLAAGEAALSAAGRRSRRARDRGRRERGGRRGPRSPPGVARAGAQRRAVDRRACGGGRPPGALRRGGHRRGRAGPAERLPSVPESVAGGPPDRRAAARPRDEDRRAPGDCRARSASTTRSTRRRPGARSPWRHSSSSSSGSALASPASSSMA
jgi:hypothetical protein